MSYSLYIVAPRPYSEAAWASAMGIDDYLDFVKRPTETYKAMMVRSVPGYGEQAKNQGNVRRDGGS